MKNNWWLFTAVMLVVVGVLSFIAGRLTYPTDEQIVLPASDPGEISETRAGGYTLINPLLECDNFKPSRLNSIVELESDVNAYIGEVLSNKKAEHVSVYFRDLNFGPWVGVNERDDYSPASLLKVPILIAALKKAEQEPAFFKKKVKYDARRELVVNPNIIDTGLVKLGNSYTIEDLVYKMIAHSDNEAKALVIENIGDALFAKVMTDIGIRIEGVKPGDDFVSVKTYSSFFRLLYNATYLSREMSEKALEILSKTSYNRGIKAGLPKNITVAHKFGERAFDNNDIKQLHDCGIVYIRDAPYLLCVMTRGKDFDQLATVIAGVSEIVYKNVTTP